MSKILAFGASNSRNSINRRLAEFTASQIKGAEVNLVDLNDYEMPIFSIDREKETGIPEKAIAFKELIREADAFVISFAEHNGGFTAAYKNIYDWISRIERNIWLDKPMFLLSTSPGSRGGKRIFEYLQNDLPRQNANVVASFSLPSFKENMSDTGILDNDLREVFNSELLKFEEALK